MHKNITLYPFIHLIRTSVPIYKQNCKNKEIVAFIPPKENWEFAKDVSKIEPVTIITGSVKN